MDIFAVQRQQGFIKIRTAFAYFSFMIETCACWHPRLRMVIPLTFGLHAYPANREQSSSDMPRVSPQPSP